MHPIIVKLLQLPPKPNLAYISSHFLTHIPDGKQTHIQIRIQRHQHPHHSTLMAFGKSAAISCSMIASAATIS